MPTNPAARDALHRITLREVGLRDGLQCLARPVSTAFKCDWILLAYAAGLRHIEVGCYGPSQQLPQMSDTPEVVAFAQTLDDLEVSVQVQDVAGAEQAFDAGVAWVTVPLPACDQYGTASFGRNAVQMLAVLQHIRSVRDRRMVTTQIEAGISAAFGSVPPACVEHESVLELARQSLGCGVDRIGLADTFGSASVQAAYELFQQVRSLIGHMPLNAHLHDDGHGQLCVVEAALDAGVTHVDASLAGIGGNRLLPGMHGNVCLEDVAALLQRRGIETGLDLRTLHELRQFAGRNPDALALFGAIARAAEQARRQQRFL
jgi:hydroxymethylglutaryl-CoA lyase